MRVLFVGVFVAACGTTATPDAGTKVCVPGASVACVGPGGCNGAQVCNSAGTALGVCDCGAQTDGGAEASDDASDAKSDGASMACVAQLAGGYDYTCALKARRHCLVLGCERKWSARKRIDVAIGDARTGYIARKHGHSD